MKETVMMMMLVMMAILVQPHPGCVPPSAVATVVALPSFLHFLLIGWTLDQ